MKVCVVAALLLVTSLLMTPTVQAQSNNAPVLIQPGLWEISIQMVAPSVTPASTSTVCITAAAGRPGPPSLPANGDCRVLNLPAAASEVAYKVVCGKAKRTMEAKFTYFGDRFEGWATTQELSVDVRMTYTGKRLGACDAANNANSAPAGDAQ